MSESYGAVRGGKSPKVNCLCATLHVCYPGMGDLVEDRAVFALLVASSRYVERLRLGHEGRHAAVNVEEMAAAHVSPRPVARAASQVWYTFHPDGRTEDTIVW